MGRRIAIAEDLKKKLRDMGYSPDPPEPDVLFNHAQSKTHLVLECKAQGFSAESSATKQCIKLLATCGQPDSALGASHATVIYVLPSEDAADHRRTLYELTEIVHAASIASAESGTLGLEIDGDGLWGTLTLIQPSTNEYIESAVGKIFITEGDDGDARPLYLVPFDPTAFPDQVDSEKEYCSAQLTERIMIYAIGVVGQAQLPNTLRFDGRDALSSATHGVSKYWEAKELAKLRVRVIAEINRVLNRGSLRGQTEIIQAGQELELHLSDEKERRAALSLLHKAEITSISQKLVEDQIRLGESD
ncbi:hypothetical protein [Cryptosporangium sp. NPDC051539]|uniref:hypothetical protein n=1 Tax=Cryptosporangium sp. NPDC051539 TaxID=3363962 RepID=UPI00378B8F61